MKKFHVRQGDVLIERVDELPSELAPKGRDRGRVILAYGEVTGHAHAICEEDVEMYTDVHGTLWLKAPSGATVVHEEHGTIPLPAGSYRVTHQREYHPAEIRRVVD